VIFCFVIIFRNVQILEISMTFIQTFKHFKHLFQNDLYDVSHSFSHFQSKKQLGYTELVKPYQNTVIYSFFTGVLTLRLRPEKLGF